MDSKLIKNGLFLATLTGALLVPSQQLAAADTDDALLLPGIGMEKVLNDYYLSGIDGDIEEYLVPTVKGEYLDMGFADVQEGSFLYIRSEPSINSDWVGKLYKNYAAKLAGPVGEWTKIESGSVTGYVKTEYLITGNAAQQKAEELVNAQQEAQETAAQTDTLQPQEAAQPEQQGSETPSVQQEGNQVDGESTDSQKAEEQADDKTTENQDKQETDSKSTESQDAANQAKDQEADNQSTETKDAANQMKDQEADNQSADKDQAKEIKNAEQSANTQETETKQTSDKAKESFSYAESKEEEAARIAAETEQIANGPAATAETAAGQNTPALAASASGQAVVDYACQFLGNPYVWGGTSLTNGADCSGFVQSVYANFGVSLPRVTWDMENAGVGVSYDQAIPGDIILYDGHVGIYMGNGQIVNAIDEAHGIGITSATYTNIITVRRLL